MSILSGLRKFKPGGIAHVRRSIGRPSPGQSSALRPFLPGGSRMRGSARWRSRWSAPEPSHTARRAAGLGRGRGRWSRCAAEPVLAVYLPGVSFAIASAKRCAKAFTVSQSAFRVSGTTTWRPLPPVVFAKLSSRIARSRSRTSLAASINAVHGDCSLSRIEIKGYPVRRLDIGERRAPGMDLQHACLDEG